MRRSSFHFLSSCGHMKFTFSCLFIFNLVSESFSATCPFQQHGREGELSIVRKKMWKIFSNPPAGQTSPQEIISLGTAEHPQSRVSAYAVKGCCLLSINKIFLDFKSILNLHEGAFSLVSSLSGFWLSGDESLDSEQVVAEKILETEA